MPTELPETTRALGTRTVYVVPEADIADPEALTVAAITGGFKATAYIYGDGGMVTGEQQKGQAPKKLAEVKQREQLGVVNETISDIQYSYKPQGDSVDEANAMKEACPQGARVYVIDRLGVLDDVDLAADQVVNAHLVILGYQNRTKTGDDDYAEHSITQSAVTVSSHYDITVTAA